MGCGYLIFNAYKIVKKNQIYFQSIYLAHQGTSLFISYKLGTVTDYLNNVATYMTVYQYIFISL